MMTTGRLVSGAALAILAAVPVRGQAAIESLFSQTEAVTISGAVGCVVGDAVTADGGDCGIYSFGIEALIELSEGGDGWGVEMALGYGQTTGYRSANPDLDLRGAVRALPSVAAYASRPLGWGPVDELYLGVSTGFLQLHNMKAYDSAGRQYGISGETFEFGLALGLYNRSGFFLEPSYRIRYFPSLDWSFPDGVDALPEGWPRSLELSGPSLSLGYQFAVGGDDDGD